MHLESSHNVHVHLNQIEVTIGSWVLHHNWQRGERSIIREREKKRFNDWMNWTNGYDRINERGKINSWYYNESYMVCIFSHSDSVNNKNNPSKLRSSSWRGSKMILPCVHTKALLSIHDGGGIISGPDELFIKARHWVMKSI